MFDSKKVVILLRSCSNAGKSTLAEYLESIYPYENLSFVCCADDYFYNNGVYQFDASRLGFAHNECRRKYLQYLQDGVGLVIVANTNTRTSDVNFYQEWAKELEYKFFSLVVEKRHENLNDHRVPEETLQKQEGQIRGSLKLR